MIEPLSVQDSDGCLVRSNIGALMTATGNIDAGRQVLEHTAEKLAGVADFSAYSLYFLHSNLAVARWVDRGSAETAFRKASAAAERLDKGFRPYALMRLKLLREGIENGTRELDRLADIFNREGPQIGETWKLHGRPLAFSDLQFWTEN
jgi:hypothetical protein